MTLANQKKTIFEAIYSKAKFEVNQDLKEITKSQSNGELKRLFPDYY